MPYSSPIPAPAAKTRLSAGKLKKWLRRAHMFAGLLMLPWLLFFGISGLLFNHPNLAADVQGQRVGSAELRELSGLEPWDPAAAAEQVVDGLNATSDHYALDPEYAPRFDGFTVLGAPAPDGRYMMVLDVERAAGVLITRHAPPRNDENRFPTRHVEASDFSVADVEAHVQGLLDARGMSVVEPLRMHPEIAPELRFRVRDADGSRWNLVYDTRSGEVTGRRSEAWPTLELGQVFSMLHTTHHFPLSVNPLWFWALFEDLLALTMVFWAVTGLIMWWQVKRTRIAGIASIALAVGIAAAVMGGTFDHLVFGDVQAQLGPGE